jgi:hypothetical protein
MWEGSPEVPETFSERLLRRQREWWGRPRLRDAPHRWRESRARRSRDDPDEAWRCCERWQRTLCNKWNGREFAVRNGLDVPALLWSGGPIEQVPLDALPASYVIKPEWGGGRRGVLVVAEGRELLRGPAGSPGRVLVEECMSGQDGRPGLPPEFKLHVFGGEVAAVQVIEREFPPPSASRFYTPGWEPIEDPMDLSLTHGEVRPPPEGLEDMVAAAARIGAQLATYMRIDVFATGRGLMHNEFSSIPNRGLEFSPYCDEWFGRLWAELVPRAT